MPRLFIPKVFYELWLADGYHHYRRWLTPEKIRIAFYKTTVQDETGFPFGDTKAEEGLCRADSPGQAFEVGGLSFLQIE